MKAKEYKVGDPVKNIGDDGIDLTIGKIYPVTEILKHGLIVTDDVEESHYISFKHLEHAHTN